MNSKILVGSQNPVKINATRLAFEHYFTSFTIEGKSSSSEVNDQPLSSEETLTGAKNRVKNILQFPAEYYVGIEGGVEKRNQDYEAFAWIVIQDTNGKQGISKTASFTLPKKVSKLIDQGLELGEADDQVFQRQNSKQQNGAVGLLTQDIITRTSYYQEAIVLALVPFINSELY